MQIEVSADQCTALAAYVELLVKWNKVINLTAVRGLPGIPLAILKPHLNVTLIDSVAKKTRFIQQAATELQLPNVSVLHNRVESVELQADLVIARAFAAPDKLAALAQHLLPHGGRLLAMVGHVPEADIFKNISGFLWIKTAKLTIPDETAERNIVILERDLS